jgi:hypothetical protein
MTQGHVKDESRVMGFIRWPGTPMQSSLSESSTNGLEVLQELRKQSKHRAVAPVGQAAGLKEVPGPPSSLCGLWGLCGACRVRRCVGGSRSVPPHSKSSNRESPGLTLSLRVFESLPKESPIYVRL